MGTAELLALSLGLSLLLAGVAYGLVRLFEASTPDPVLREKAWAMALYLPALPIVLVGVALLLPPPVAAGVVGLEDTGSTSSVIEIIVQQGVPAGSVAEPLAFGALALAGLLAFVRMIWLARRTARLHRLIQASDPAPQSVRQIVEDAARRLAAPMPDVRVRTGGGEALTADLSCTVQADGSVTGCTILNETPVGAGYAAAAVAAAADARLSPRSVEGVAVGGAVRFTIRFTREAE